MTFAKNILYRLALATKVRNNAKLKKSDLSEFYISLAQIEAILNIQGENDISILNVICACGMLESSVVQPKSAHACPEKNPLPFLLFRYHLSSHAIAEIILYLHIVEIDIEESCLPEIY